MCAGVGKLVGYREALYRCTSGKKKGVCAKCRTQYPPVPMIWSLKNYVAWPLIFEGVGMALSEWLIHSQYASFI